MPATIGVLSFQGSVAEHMAALAALPDVRALEVRSSGALAALDGLILPGGESTTIARLMRLFGVLEPLRARIREGMPVWGTCAGMILLAREIEGEQAHLGVMDIAVRRNAYGRQIDSFAQKAMIPAFSAQPVPLVFIRAPWIERAGADVRILCTVDGHIVAAEERNMLATSFHPELTEERSVHAYFADKARAYAARR